MSKLDIMNFLRSVSCFEGALPEAIRKEYAKFGSKYKEPVYIHQCMSQAAIAALLEIAQAYEPGDGK